MQRAVTKGIVLKRVNYGEADRIITVLTPNHGKLRLMVRGARKMTSKLAGGIELFGVSDITWVQGRGELGTLISARSEAYFDAIIKDIDRLHSGQELIKLLDQATEDHPEPEYFHLLQNTFAALNEPQIDLELIKAWFAAQLVKLAGHTPNLQTDTSGQKLKEQPYNFDYDAMAFVANPQGVFKAAEIKALRLLFTNHLPEKLQQIQDLPAAAAKLAGLLSAIIKQNGILYKN